MSAEGPGIGLGATAGDVHLIVRDVGRVVPAFEVGNRERVALPGEELILLDLCGVMRGLQGDDGQRRATGGRQRGGGSDSSGGEGCDGGEDRKDDSKPAAATGGRSVGDGLGSVLLHLLGEVLAIGCVVPHDIVDLDVVDLDVGDEPRQHYRDRTCNIIVVFGT